MSYVCGTCSREFPNGWKARDQHCRDSGHERPPHECDTCERYFDSEDNRCAHMDRYKHWGDDAVLCPICELKFGTDAACRAHETESHFFCHECDRHFFSQARIQMHLRSARHKAEGDSSCPFCALPFANASAIVEHIESGRCAGAPLDREVIYRAVRRYDPRGVVSKSLGPPAVPSSSSSSYPLANADVAAEPDGAPPRLAARRAWNPRVGAYQCYLCPKQCRRLAWLNAHLTSPAHRKSLYHCPNGRCMREFAVLASLVKHLESEVCGFMKFREVQGKARNEYPWLISWSSGEAEGEGEAGGEGAA